MKHKLVSPSELTLMMLTNGKIAIDVENWHGGDAVQAFGEDGDCPPISISSLTRQLMDNIKASPDQEDAAALKSALSELETSTQIVKSTILMLNKD